MKNRFEKTLVIGTSCCVKTTFTQKLAEIPQSRHTELEAILWLPGWNSVNTMDFVNSVEKEVSEYSYFCS